MTRLRFVVVASACALAPPAVPLQAGPPTAAPCFAPGTSQKYIDEVVDRLAGRTIPNSLTGRTGIPGFQFGDSDRWSATVTSGGGLRQGDPTVITWSIVPDGTPIDGWGGEAANPSNLRAWLSSNWGPETIWLPLFQSVFDRWSELNGITYVYEPTDDGAGFTCCTNPCTTTCGSEFGPGVLGVRGDVRIAGHRIDGTANTLAYNFFPDLSEMVIDTSDTFLVGKANNSLRLRNTLAHEHGHGIGLSHVCPINNTKLMEPTLSEAFDGPQHDDILGSNRGYGDALEPDDSAAAAASLGPLTPGTDITRTNLSIDDNGDGDYLSFAVATAVDVSITLTPLGATYLSGPQPSAGPCGPGANFDSLNVHNLSFELRDTDRTTVLATAARWPRGIPESVTDFPLGAAGTYYVRVVGDATNAAQLYNLALAAKGGGIPTCDLMQGDTTFPPTSPTIGSRYSAACPGGNRLAVLNTLDVSEGDLGDSFSGSAGSLRLYQVGCGCDTSIQLTKNTATGRVVVSLL